MALILFCRKKSNGSSYLFFLSFFKYTSNGTTVQRRRMKGSLCLRKCLRCHQVPGYRVVIRAFLHLKLAPCQWCWLFLTVDWQHVLAGTFKCPTHHHRTCVTVFFFFLIAFVFWPLLVHSMTFLIYLFPEKYWWNEMICCFLSDIHWFDSSSLLFFSLQQRTNKPTSTLNSSQKLLVLICVVHVCDLGSTSYKSCMSVK